jgi:thiol-disulfide isomerase/thioredoxin
MDRLIKDLEKKNPQLKLYGGIKKSQINTEDPLYDNGDAVVILDDASFMGKKIMKKKFKGPGILKAYAPWCPHCRNKTTAIKVLAQLMNDNNTGYAFYVLDAEENTHASSMLKVQGFPTFYRVNANGEVGQILKDISGVEDLHIELCKIDAKLCFKGAI